MNLIEELGIVVGDQVQYTGGTDMTIYTVKEAYSDFVVASGGAFDFLTMLGCEIQKAESLQADHDQQLCGQSEEKEFNSGDLVALNGELFPDFKLLYVVKQESKRFGFVAVYLSGEEIRNFHTRDVRRATEKELDLGYRVTQTPYSNTEYFNTRKIEADHCTDIKNHISPNTKVSER